MSKSEKFVASLLLFAVYIFIGAVVSWLLDDVLAVVPLADTAPVSEYAGMILLWPLFLIKYLAIGLWAVVYSGFSLLF